MTSIRYNIKKQMEQIEITDKASNAILSRMGQDKLGVRLSVKATGCSGNSYVMEPVGEGDDVSGDDRFELGGAVLYIPKTHSWMLFGLKIDYGVDDLGNEKFLFINPNETGRCGCGESFQVDKT